MVNKEIVIKKEIVLKKEDKLPTEDEIEREAYSGSWLYSLIKISKVERRMFWILSFMFSLCAFVCSIGRSFKDGIILNKQLPLSINCLKILFVLPVTIICVGIFQKLSICRSYPIVFDYALICFSFILIVMGLIILPASHYLQLDSEYFKNIFSDGKCRVRGYDGLLALVLIFNEWTSSFTYVLLEVFGNLFLAFFFMTYINSLTTPGQSARFVPALYVFSNISLFLSGIVAGEFSRYRPKITFKQAELFYNGFFILSGIILLFVLFLKRYLEKFVISKPLFIPKSITKKKSKETVGFCEGLQEMIKSRLLLHISLTVIFYGICTNIVESTYKNGLKKGAEEFGRDVTDYGMSYASFEQKLSSILSILALLSPFPNMIRTRGWIYVAIVFPLVIFISMILICGLAFYNFPATNNDRNYFLNLICASPGHALMALENNLGVICVSLMKASKFAAFDISKESISMQIDSSVRPRYKGIFDGVFGKLGKSLGSVIVFLLGTFFQVRDFRKLSPISICIVLVFISIWIYSVFYLNGKYKEAISQNQCIDIDYYEKYKIIPEIDGMVLGTMK